MRTAEKLDGDEQTKRCVFFVTVLASFTTPFMASSVNVAMPRIGQDLHLSASGLSWVVTGFLVAAAACLLPVGRAADLYGRKKVFLLGLAVFAFPSILCAAARSGAWLILGRVIQGIGGAMVFGTSMAIVTSVFPGGERGRIIGFNVGAVYSGLALGPVLGGVITDRLGWRWLFLLHLALGAMAFVVALLRLEGEWKDNRLTNLDLPSAVLYVVALIAIMCGVSWLTTAGYAPAALLSGIALLAVFIWRQAAGVNPLLEIGLFHSPAFAFSNLAALIHYSATFAIGFLMSIFLQAVQGETAQNAGLVLLSQPLMMAIVSPLAGRLSDRFQARILASVGMSITCAGVVVFCFLGRDFPIAYIVLNLVLIGVGFGMFSSPNTNAVMSAVEGNYYGVASATLGTMRVVGQAMSMAVVNLFFALHMRGQAISPEAAQHLVEAIRPAFIVFAVLCFAGIWASLARGSGNTSSGPASG